MSAIRHPLRLGAAALVAAAAACSNASTAPKQITDPASVVQQVQGMDSTFASAAYDSYLGVSLALSSGNAALASPFSRTAAILTATAPATQGAPAAAARAAAVRQVVPALVSTGTAAIIPDSIKGTTFTWDSASASYVPSALTGADTAGVRFILYAVDPLTKAISYPLTPVGWLDLIDKSDSSTARLQITVADSNRIYLSDLVSGSGSQLAFTLSATGYVQNEFRRVDFTVTFHGALTSFTLHEALDDNTNDVHLTYDYSFSVSINGADTSATVSATFTFSQGQESVQLVGSGTASTVTGLHFTLSVGAGGGVFAKITVANDTVTITDQNGNPLDPNQIAAVAKLYGAAFAALDRLNGFVLPFIILAKIGTSFTLG